MRRARLVRFAVGAAIWGAAAVEVARRLSA